MLGKWSYIQIPLFICGIKYSFTIWTILVQEKSTLVNNLFTVRFSRNWYRICCNHMSADSKVEKDGSIRNGTKRHLMVDWIYIVVVVQLLSHVWLLSWIYILYTDTHTHTYILYICIYFIYIYIYIYIYIHTHTHMYIYIFFKASRMILRFWNFGQTIS